MNYVIVTLASVFGFARRHPAVLASAAALMWAPAAALSQTELPALPQQTVDTAYAPPSGGTTREVCSSGCQYSSIQAAIDAAARGDMIVVRAGETFEQPIILRNKGAGSDWIYIVSSALDQLPAPGTRVSPSDAANMPRLRVTDAGSTPVIRTENNASHYRLVGLEVTQTSYRNTTIELGSYTVTSAASTPSDLVIDRCYVHGTGVTSKSGRRGVLLGSRRSAVIDSYISDYWETGFDSQGIAGWYGPGPYKIENNYISGGSENIMFGGARPNFAVTPSDIVIRRNHLHKPDHWLPSNPAYDGLNRGIKNSLEFKNAQRVLIEGNILENNDAQAQSGRIFLITPATSGACESFTKTSDITVRFNKFVNSPEGLNITGRDGSRAGVPTPCEYLDMVRTQRVNFHDNLFERISSNLLYLPQTGAEFLIIEHNTGFSPGVNAVYMNSNPNSPSGSRPKLVDFTFRNNILDGRLQCDGGGVGEQGLNECTTTWTVRKNAMVGQAAASNPPDNFFPQNVAAVGFVDQANGDYSLRPDSPYKNAGTDGQDLGVDFDYLESLTSGVRSGTGGAPATGVPTVEGVRRTDTLN